MALLGRLRRVRCFGTRSDNRPLRLHQDQPVFRAWQYRYEYVRQSRPEVLGEKRGRTCTMTAQPTKRRGVAWALAAGAVGLSVGLGGGVLLPGLALADDGSTKTFGLATLEADRELVVPAGTCGVTWTLVGGFGGNGPDDAVGSAPGHVVATTTVTAGQTYRIGVGQPGSAADLETEAEATAGGASTVTLHTEDSDEVVLGAGGGNAASSGHEANVVGAGIPEGAVTANGAFTGTSAEGSVVTAELVACPPVVVPQLVSAEESPRSEERRVGKEC